MLNKTQTAYLEAYLENSLFLVLDDSIIDSATRFAAYQCLWKLFQDSDRGYWNHYQPDFMLFLFPEYGNIHASDRNLVTALKPLIEVFEHPCPQNPVVSYTYPVPGIKEPDPPEELKGIPKVRMAIKDKDGKAVGIYFLQKGLLGLFNNNTPETVEPVCKEDVTKYFAERLKTKILEAKRAFESEEQKKNVIESQKQQLIPTCTKPLLTEVGIFNRQSGENDNLHTTAGKTLVETDSAGQWCADINAKINLKDYRPSQVALPTGLMIRPTPAATSTLKVCVVGDSFDVGKRFAITSLPKFIKQIKERLIEEMKLTQNWEIEYISLLDIINKPEPDAVEKIQAADVVYFFQKGELFNIMMRKLQSIVSDPQRFDSYVIVVDDDSDELYFLDCSETEPPTDWLVTTPSEAFKTSYALCYACEKFCIKTSPAQVLVL